MKLLSQLRKIALITISTSLLIACTEGSAQHQGEGAPAPKVTAAQPLIRNISDSHIFTGRYEAAQSVDIRARVSGYLQSIDFEDGALVKKGDKLFVIDPRPFQAIVTQRRADLNAANSRIKLAQNTFDRTDSLFKTGDVSAQIRDQRQSELNEARAAVAQAKAALDAAELDLSYTTITAPISGRISRNRVSVGNLINPGQDVLTTILSVDPIHFYFDIDEQSYLKYLRQNSDTSNLTASLSLSDEQNFPHPAYIDFIDNTLSLQTGTMRGRAVTNNPTGLITPGMFGRIRMSGATPYQAILVPDSAIGTDQSRKFVLTVGPEGKIMPVTVDLGPIANDGVHNGLRVIRSGLKGDEVIVINGLQRAQPGARVAPEIIDLSSQYPLSSSHSDEMPNEISNETPDEILGQ